MILKKRKITRLSLAELAKEVPTLSETISQACIGGGSGYSSDPYTIEEMDRMIESGSWTGGYVLVDNHPQYVGSACIVTTSGSTQVVGESVSRTTSIIIDGFGGFGYAAGAEECFGPKTRLGSNGRMYHITANGQVFRGNQYVKTIDVARLGRGISRWANYASLGVSAYSVVSTAATSSSPFRDTCIAISGAIGGTVGSLSGSYVGGAIGGIVGPPGVVVGSISGSVMGGYIGAEATESFMSWLLDELGL